MANLRDAHYFSCVMNVRQRRRLWLKGGFGVLAVLGDGLAGGYPRLASLDTDEHTEVNNARQVMYAWYEVQRVVLDFG